MKTDALCVSLRGGIPRSFNASHAALQCSSYFELPSLFYSATSLPEPGELGFTLSLPERLHRLSNNFGRTVTPLGSLAVAGGDHDTLEAISS